MEEPCHFEFNFCNAGSTLYNKQEDIFIYIILCCNVIYSTHKILLL